MLWFVGVSALLLAFSNGANDNFKGFATVWGSGTLSYRLALALATVAAVAGSATSLLLAGEMIKAFSGAGLVPVDVAAAPIFMAAVGSGAAFTVLIASRVGFPISTTHALLGGMIGAAFGLGDGGVDAGQLTSKFALPLLLSPLIAAVAGLGAYRFLRRRAEKDECICLVAAGPDKLVMAPPSVSAMRLSSAASLVIAPTEECDDTVVLRRVEVSPLLNQLHILSATTICFARSLNDTPKLAALLVSAQLSGISSMLAIAILMAGGGILFSRRVAETMSLRLNHIDARQGLSANVITAALVLFASKFGVPVSTTHVAVGSIAGIGAYAGTVSRKVLRDVLLSWVATLPSAAAVAWVVARTL